MNHNPDALKPAGKLAAMWMQFDKHRNVQHTDIVSGPTSAAMCSIPISFVNDKCLQSLQDESAVLQVSVDGENNIL